MFSNLFDLSRKLFSSKTIARRPRSSRFHLIEDLEARQLLSATGRGDDSDFSPRIIAAIATQPTDLNWATDYQAVGAFLIGPAAGSTTAPTATNYVGTGTVIKNTAGSIWVLTSAQLAVSLTTSNTFYLNTGTIATPVFTNYAVNQVVKHSKYTPTISGVNNLGQPSANDVALVKLTYSPSGTPAALPNIVAAPILETVPPTTSTLVQHLVGWGESGTAVAGETVDSEGTKLYGKVSVKGPSSTHFSWTFKPTSTLLQSNYATGDIGAPAFVKLNSGGVTAYYLTSIASYGSKASSGHVTGELRSNTRVDAYAQWMHDVMGDAVTAAVSVDDFKDVVNAAFGTPSASAFTNIDKKVTLSTSSSTATGTATNVLATRADHDVIKIVVNKAGLASFRYTSTDFDPVLQVYSQTTAATASTAAVTASLGAAGFSDDVALSKNRDAYAINVSLAAGTYYVDMYSYDDPATAGTVGSGRGKGTLSISIAYDEDGGANVYTTPITSKVLSKTGTMTASAAFQTTSDADFYKFKATVTGLMQVDVRTATGVKVDTAIEIYNSTGTVALSEQVTVLNQADDLVHEDVETGLTIIDSLNSKKTVSVVKDQYYYLKVYGIAAATSAAKSGLPTTLLGYGSIGGYTITIKTTASL